MTAASKPKTPKRVTLYVWQDGMVVAMVNGPVAKAMADAAHYAFMYGQDGPVSITKTNRCPAAQLERKP